MLPFLNEPDVRISTLEHQSSVQWVTFYLWCSQHHDVSENRTDSQSYFMRQAALKYAETHHDKHLLIALDPVRLTMLSLVDKRIWRPHKLFPLLSWLILLIFKELSPRPIGLGFAIKGRAVKGFQMKEFIKMEGNKGCLAVEYWLCMRSDWSNWWGCVRKNVGEELEGGGGTSIMAIRLH